MRIAYFSIEFPPRIFGGLGVYVDDISREMVALGERISVFTFGDSRSEELSGYEWRGGVQGISRTHQGRSGDIPLPRDPFLGRRPLLPAGPVQPKPVGCSQAHGRMGLFDLCVAHDWLGLLGAMAVKREGVPMIYHVHGLEVGSIG